MLVPPTSESESELEYNDNDGLTTSCNQCDISVLRLSRSSTDVDVDADADADSSCLCSKSGRMDSSIGEPAISDDSVCLRVDIIYQYIGRSWVMLVILYDIIEEHGAGTHHST